MRAPRALALRRGLQRALVAALAALSGAGVAASCDVGDKAVQPTRGPALGLAAVVVATGVDGGAKVRTELTELPSAPPVVLRSTSLTLRFDRFLHPSSVVRQSVCLQASATTVTDINACVTPVFLEPSYDPVRREVTLRLEPGKRLEPDVLYRLTLYGATSDEPCSGDTPKGCGLRAFDGAPLREQLALDLRTVADDPPGDGDDLEPVLEDPFCERTTCTKACESDCGVSCATSCDASCFAEFGGCSDLPDAEKTECEACPGDCRDECEDVCVPPCEDACPVRDVVSVLQQACGLSACHGVFASSGLRLDDELGISLAIGRTAHQTQTGELAWQGEQSPSSLGRAMPIIDPGNPGNSYLLYKVLINRSIPAAAVAPTEELARLRSAVVVGNPMPIEEYPDDPATPEHDGGGLSLDELDLVRRWIAAGAPAPSCGP
jgi:hypothetical protein